MQKKRAEMDSKQITLGLGVHTGVWAVDCRSAADMDRGTVKKSHA